MGMPKSIIVVDTAAERARLRAIIASRPELLVTDHPAIKQRVPEFIAMKELRPGQRHRGMTLERTAPKVGRNQPCPCGSGKKFKKCHEREGEL